MVVQLSHTIGQTIAVANFLPEVWAVFLMLLLVAASAFFSGVETAFFNLSRRQTNLMQNSKHRMQNLAAAILGKPGQLLSGLLFGNMTVNVFFFAVASVQTFRVREQIGVPAAAGAACLSFVILVMFGEVLPKSLAYTNSKTISVAAALPVFVCLQIFKPVLFVLRLLVVEPATRLLLGPVRPSRPITHDEFRELVEASRKRGLLTADENKLLTEIIELGFLRVRHVMRPRVDMVACNVTDSFEQAHETLMENRLTKVPVYADTIDNILGLLHLRDLLLEPDRSLHKLVSPVQFVPEQRKVDSLLEFFRHSHTDTAIVVDEYGGIAGTVRLEDIAEELLGPIEVTASIEPIEQIGPFQYRLAGNLPIHDWAQRFRIDPAETRLSTVGGLVTALLGRIPKAGDVAYLKNLKFTVEGVRKHRIETLILTLESVPDDDQ